MIAKVILSLITVYKFCIGEGIPTEPVAVQLMFLTVFVVCVENSYKYMNGKKGKDKKHFIVDMFFIVVYVVNYAFHFLGG